MSVEQLYGSDRAVRVLGELGIEHVALNPGATTRGLHDSLVHAPGPKPAIVTCLHEEIAVALAHGYAKASGRPMACALHDTVGLLHASMAIFNAWVDRVPMLLLTGTGPVDSSRRRPWIDWVHTVQDQGELVREFTVWNDQPGSIAAMAESLRRGWQRAVTPPGGPALIGLDVLLQEELASGMEGGPLHADLLHVSRPAPDPALVTEIVNRLRASRRPLFITDRPISQAASDALVALAEKSGAALLDMGGGVGFPVGHPHDVTEAAGEAVARADLLVFVEARDPGWALGRVDLVSRRMSGEAPGTAAISIGLAGLMSRSWMVTESNLPHRLTVNAEAELTMVALLEVWGGKRRQLDRNYERMAARPVPIAPRGLNRGTLAQLTADATRPYAPVVASGLLHGWARRAFRYQRAGDFLGRSGGDGLGYAAPAAVGAGLALRGSDRMTVALQSDGDLLYAPQALWTAAHESIPLLMIIDANRSYGQDRSHQEAMARARGRSTQRLAEGIDLSDPPVALADMARSFGIHAEGPIADSVELEAALTRAVELVRGGAPAAIEVLTDVRGQ